MLILVDLSDGKFKFYDSLQSITAKVRGDLIQNMQVYFQQKDTKNDIYVRNKGKNIKQRTWDKVTKQ
jgi:hypothetical protein